MKFFKKLGSSNSDSNKKLSFLKPHKKDKRNTETSLTVDNNISEKYTSEDNDSLLELNLPNDFTTSFDMPQFDNKQSKEGSYGVQIIDSTCYQSDFINNEKTIENTSPSNDSPLKMEVNRHSADKNTKDSENKALDSTKIDNSLLFVQLENRTNKQVELNIVNRNEEIEVKSKPIEKQENVLENESFSDSLTTNYENMAVFEEAEDHGEMNCISTTEKEKGKLIQNELILDSSEKIIFESGLVSSSNTEVESIISPSLTDEKKDENIISPSASTEKIAIENFSDNRHNAPTECEKGTIKLVVISETAIEGKKEGGDCSTDVKISQQEPKKMASIENLVSSKSRSSYSDKKNVDKRRSMQSLIPRKQFQQPVKEDEKKKFSKEKKRQSNSSTSSIPVASSNKLTITTTVVVDTNNPNEYYYAQMASSSPSSATSTSTTTTNGSENSNNSIKKSQQTLKPKVAQQQQSHIQSKIPIASSLTSLKSATVQSLGNCHHSSRLPKKKLIVGSTL